MLSYQEYLSKYVTGINYDKETKKWYYKLRFSEGNWQRCSCYNLEQLKECRDSFIHYICNKYMNEYNLRPKTK